MEPASGVEKGQSQAPPDRKKWIIVGLVLVGVLAIAAATLPGLLMKPSRGVAHPIGGTVTPTTPATGPATLGRTVSPSPGITRAPRMTPIPTATGTPPARTCTPTGPPEFTVTVSPVEAEAARGETVTYHMTIDAQNCFSENVSMKLTASVLFILSNTYDLGTQDPPYPKTFEYALTVPDSLFSGATVNGVLTSTGGGITRENQLTLHVR
jgi:hypothetical protein